MRLRLIGMVLPLAAIAAVPVPAHATAVCYEVNRVTFNPPLRDYTQSGTFDFDYSKQCVRDNGTVYSASSSGLRFFYTGNCVVASISAPSSATIVGGLLYVEPKTGNAREGVLVPDSANPCAFYSGSVYGPKID